MDPDTPPECGASGALQGVVMPSWTPQGELRPLTAYTLQVLLLRCSIPARLRSGEGAETGQDNRNAGEANSWFACLCLTSYRCQQMLIPH